MNFSAVNGMEATRTLGKYTLVRHLATGGMAEIWLAEQLGPGGFNKELVIKQILPHLARDEAFTRMFLDEARLAAQLSHPKIAQIYELGEAAGEYFIAMEFIDGIDLSDLIELAKAKDYPIPLNVAAKAIMDILEALDYAHDFTLKDGTALNLVHRDVTPHNVIISNDGIVKLVDFGVAKAKANQSKTQTGAVKGKYAYMAPEQIQSQEIDRRVDIFAVGVLFYETLTGEKPFGDDLAAVTNILMQPVPNIQERRQDLPAVLDDIIRKATAKNPDERYVDAHDMLRDIEAFLREHSGYVGDREVASYIREMRGLPTTRHTAASSKAPSQPQPRPSSNPGQHSTPEPAPYVTGGVAEAPRERTQEEIMLEQGDTGAIGAVGGPEAGLIRTDTQTVDSVGSLESVPQKSNTGLIVLFTFLFLVVTGVGGYVIWSMIQTTPPPPSNNAVVVKPVVKDPVKSDAPEVPASFNHGSSGVPVSVSCNPPADVFYKGEKVGVTNFTTTLRAGEYEVEFKSKTVNKKKTLKVSLSNPINRISCR